MPLSLRVPFHLASFMQQEASLCLIVLGFIYVVHRVYHPWSPLLSISHCITVSKFIVNSTMSGYLGSFGYYKQLGP